MTTTILLKAKDTVPGCKFMLAGNVCMIGSVEPYPGERVRIWYMISATNSVVALPLILPDEFDLEIHY